MPSLRLQTLRSRLRHVRRNSKTLAFLRLGITLLLCVCAAVALLLYGTRLRERLAPGSRNSLSVLYGNRLAGRITAEDLTDTDAQGRAYRPVQQLLNELGAEPLQGESVICSLADGTKMDLPEEYGSGACLALQSGRWMLLLPDGGEYPLVSLSIHIHPLEDEENTDKDA